MAKVFNLELNVKCPKCGGEVYGFDFENWDRDHIVYFGVECMNCFTKFIVDFHMIEIEREQESD